jgi:ribosomal protein L29
MKRVKEMEELRRKDPRTILSELEREKKQHAKDRIAARLGKRSKVHEVAARRIRIARMMTVLSEKIASGEPKGDRP